MKEFKFNLFPTDKFTQDPPQLILMVPIQIISALITVGSVMYIQIFLLKHLRNLYTSRSFEEIAIKRY